MASNLPKIWSGPGPRPDTGPHAFVRTTQPGLHPAQRRQAGQPLNHLSYMYVFIRFLSKFGDGGHGAKSPKTGVVGSSRGDRTRKPAAFVHPTGASTQYVSSRQWQATASISSKSDRRTQPTYLWPSSVRPGSGPRHPPRAGRCPVMLRTLTHEPTSHKIARHHPNLLHSR